ncbi:MAG: glycosyltransferase family 4 protein [Magnetospirillum sp.]|nr:glycosyltransferase family 4 protein [Magnetospirillum sp.]
MRILIIHERYRQRGGEDRVFDLESAMLEARGCQVERLIIDNRDIRDGQGQLALAANALWSRKGRSLVRDAVRRFRPQVAHIHNWFPLLSPSIHSAIREDGIPVVQTLHNFRNLCLNGLFFRDGAPCEDCLDSSLKWRGVLRRCYRDDIRASATVAALTLLHHHLGTWRRHVDLFLAYSEFSRQRFIAGGLPADRIAIKPNTTPDPGEDAASWRHPRRGAVYVGRLSEEKGIGDLVRAWRDMGHTLTVVGDGPLGEQLRAEASSEVEFVGWRSPEEVSVLLARAALVCVPSLCYEQWPMAVTEAAAHGVAVLASNFGAMGRLIKPRHTGDLVPVGDIRAWRDQAVGLLNAPERLAAMGSAARQSYLDQYSPPSVTDQLLAHYHRLVESRPSRPTPITRLSV